MYLPPTTVRNLRKQLKPITATLRIEGVNVLNHKEDLGFTVPVPLEKRLIDPEAHYVTAVMRAVSYDEDRGYMVDVEYYRPDLISSNDVIHRLSEVLYDEAVKYEKGLNNILNRL